MTTRRNVHFANMRAILAVENRPQGTGSTVHREVRQLASNVDSIMGCGPKTAPCPGVEIDNTLKGKMTSYMATLLRNKRIVYSRFVTTCAVDALEHFNCPHDEEDVNTIEALQAELHAQMSRWEERTIESGPEGARTVKFFYGGKGANGQLNDDMSMAAAMVVFHPVEWAARLKRAR